MKLELADMSVLIYGKKLTIKKLGDIMAIRGVYTAEEEKMIADFKKKAEDGLTGAREDNTGDYFTGIIQKPRKI